MFLLIMITGLLPVRLKSFKSNPLIISLTKSFSGGLFLAIGILDILPEAAKNFEDYYEANNI